jgi:hypothetical protein
MSGLAKANVAPCEMAAGEGGRGGTGAEAVFSFSSAAPIHCGGVDATSTTDRWTHVTRSLYR